MPKVVIYSTGACPYCIRAKKLLEKKGVEYTDLRVDADPTLRTEMEERSRRFTVPQIFIGEFHVGGFDDMYVLELDGKLDELLDGA